MAPPPRYYFFTNKCYGCDGNPGYITLSTSGLPSKYLANIYAFLVAYLTLNSNVLRLLIIK
jgi:hypothetical protein